MSKNLFVVCLFLLAVIPCFCVPTADQVTLPIAGYNSYPWYSGYLNFSMGKFHYVFFESQTDPDNDPLVLWLNGGPGCSSLIGMSYENGPFTFIENTTKFQINNNSWNFNANMLYIESPGGVGFSKGFRNNLNTDGSVAEDNYAAVIAFFDKFPNLVKNDFYISGESYAGIYIPYLSQEILRNNKLPSRKYTIKLKGFMVGNACTDPRQCFEPSSNPAIFDMSIYQYEYLHEHGYITDRRYQELKGLCILGYTEENCSKLRNITNRDFEQTLTNINNIYAPCYHQKLLGLGSRGLQSKRLQTGLLQANETCEDFEGIQYYFNDPLTQKRFHVDEGRFDLCSDPVANKYKMNSNASQWLYPILIKAGLKIWVYSGDLDANVPITGTLNWIHRMKENEGLPVVEPWREWWVKGIHVHEDQMAGMVWKLRGFTFVSVRGAGHLVPMDKKKEAALMFNSFLKGVDLPYKSA